MHFLNLHKALVRRTQENVWTIQDGATIMAYGTFGNSIVNHYNRTTYTIGRDSYTVHIFKTDSATEKVAPAVYVNENLQLLKNMNANGIDKSRTIAKINGNVMGGGAGFFGWFYAAGQLYKQGEACYPASYGYGFRDFPTMCLKEDDSVIIRWFTSSEKMSAAIPYCRSMVIKSDDGTLKNWVYLSLDEIPERFTKIRTEDRNGIPVEVWSDGSLELRVFEGMNSVFSVTLLDDSHETKRGIRAGDSVDQLWEWYLEQQLDGMVTRNGKEESKQNQDKQQFALIPYVLSYTQEDGFLTSITISAPE